MQKKQYPIAMTIAGSDSSGGAGIQADLKTFSALGAFGTTVITAVTAQNTCGVTAIQGIQPDIIIAQGEAVLSDLAVCAIKLGMLHDRHTIEAVSSLLEMYPHLPVVADPVMVATSGDRLLQSEAVASYIQHIFPHTTLLTPNLIEAGILAEMNVQTPEEMLLAANKISQMGCDAVLIKGGHLTGTCMTDILVQKNTAPIYLHADFVTTENTHGTGCTLSAAIAALLAQGQNLEEACKEAKEYLHAALQAGAGVTVGAGHGPVNHFYKPKALKADNYTV